MSDPNSIDLDLIVSLDSIEQIPINIRDQYVTVDTDDSNLYHKSLFEADSTQNTNYEDGCTNDVNNCTNDVDDCVNDYDYDYDWIEDDDDYCGWEREEREYWERVERERKAEVERRKEEDEYQRNKHIIHSIDTPVDTRNRLGGETKKDYRTSNSLIRYDNWAGDECEISSNIKEVMGNQNGIILDDSRCPVTILNDLFPNTNLNGFGKSRYGRCSGGLGNKTGHKVMVALEEHATTKSERKALDSRQARKIIKYRVPIIRWDAVKVDRSASDKLKNTDYEYEKDAGIGIYVATTVSKTENYIDYRGNSGTRTNTYITGVRRVGGFVEATIPKGICPIDFKIDYSSSMTGKTYGKINRSTAYDPESEQMIRIGRAIDRGGYWRPHTDTNKEFLIVDLGSNTRITHISTSGAPPPVAPFPRNWWGADKFVDGYDGPNPRGGSLIYVLQESSGRWSAPTYLQNYRPYQDGMWVESYEIYARRDHGKWIRIGQYTGNSDPFTEVIHDMRRDLNDIKFRYLKFVPLSYHNHVAMKVDVFSEASAIESSSIIDRSHIEYTLEVPMPLGKNGGTTLIRKTSIYDGYRRWNADRDGALERRIRNRYLKSEVEDYHADREAYLSLYSTPKRDLHAIKYGLDRDERGIKEVKRRSLKNRDRRRAYRRRNRN